MNSQQLSSSCIKLSEKYKLYSNIVDIFPEDAKSIIESYNLEKGALQQIYGIDQVVECMHYSDIEIPILVRHQAYNGNSLEGLVNNYINYKNQAISYLKKNNIESAQVCVKNLKKYKVSAVYKYGEEQFQELLNKNHEQFDNLESKNYLDIKF